MRLLPITQDSSSKCLDFVGSLLRACTWCHTGTEKLVSTSLVSRGSTENILFLLLTTTSICLSRLLTRFPSETICHSGGLCKLNLAISCFTIRCVSRYQEPDFNFPGREVEFEASSLFLTPTHYSRFLHGEMFVYIWLMLYYQHRQAINPAAWKVAEALKFERNFWHANILCKFCPMSLTSSIQPSAKGHLEPVSQPYIYIYIYFKAYLYLLLSAHQSLNRPKLKGHIPLSFHNAP